MGDEVMEGGTATEQESAPSSQAAIQLDAIQLDTPTAAAAGTPPKPSPRNGAEGKVLGSRPPSSSNGKVSAGGSEAGLPPIHRQSSNLANRIAAYASGVAPVRKGITNTDEDDTTVEDVLHKLETAGRLGQDKCELPVPLVRSAHQHLVAAREEAARTAKELAELKASRVQHIPPSTWIKREQKYKMDQEKYEHQISQLRQRTEALERELAVLREGSNVRPLEEKIQELEHQLVAAAEEKTKVQSKFHELSIKHRQLIETSPQVATIWNEVLVQQAADGHNAAAMQRLVNFDLRHTTANSAVNKPMPDSVSQQQLPGVSAAAAVYNNSSGPPPVPPAPQFSSSSKGPADSSVGVTEQSGPSTPMQQPPLAGSPGPSSSAAAASTQQQPHTAEERAHALMAAVALEGLSPEASLAALQQLNYDLTMQLGCYQQMVSRLKDAMESSDLEKAELEADKMALEMQLAGGGGGGGGDRSTAGGARGGWSGWSWRRSIGLSGGGPAPHLDHEDSGSLAEVSSISSSRQSSMDMDAAGILAALPSGGSNANTPTKAAVDAAAAAAASVDSSSEDGKPSTEQQDQQKASAAKAGSSGGGLFAARRQRTAARAAAAAETLGKEVKELKRQVKTLQDENKYLVNNLVEIKMELAETQGSHDQAKRALVRAMDKESCMDLQVSELRRMLDMATSLNQQFEQQAASSSMAAAAGAVAAVAARAVAAVSNSTPNSAKAALAAMQSPFGRAEPDVEAAAAAWQQHVGDVAAAAGSGIGVDVDVDAAASAATTSGASAAAAAIDAAAGVDAGPGPPETASAAAAEAAGPADAGQQQQPVHDTHEVHSAAVASFQLSEEEESSFGDAEEDGSNGSSENAAATTPAKAAAAEQPPSEAGAQAAGAASEGGSKQADKAAA